MTSNDGEKWSAYLDGELTDDERSAFETNLSDDDRALLEHELRVESAITAKLADAPSCPDEVWNKLRGEIWKAEVAPTASVPRSRLQDWGIPALAAAAAVILAVALFVPAGPNNLPALLELAAADVPTLAETAEVRGPQDEIEDFLRRSGLRLEVSDVPKQVTTHPVVILGASSASFDGHDYHRLQFDCCKHPIEVIAAPADGPIAERIRAASEAGEFEGQMKELDGLLITVLGEAYHSNEVFKVIRAKIEQ